MTLEEVAYMIDGKLQSRAPSQHCVELQDYFGSTCGAEEWKDEKFVSGENATGWGQTTEEARADLVEKIKGKILVYHHPLHGMNYEGKLRIPPTLVGTKSNLTDLEIVDTGRDCAVDRLLRRT